MSYFPIACNGKEKETGEPMGFPCLAFLLTWCCIIKGSYIPHWRRLWLPAFSCCGLLSCFREKLPISEAGTAETGIYGTAAKCIQTQNQVSNETFNMASQFQGAGMNVWFNYAVIAILILHDPGFCQKEQHFMS